MHGFSDPDASCGWLYPQSYIVKLINEDRIDYITELMQQPWQSSPIDRTYDRVANKVMDSQGFCCDCDIDDFLFESYDYSRGEIITLSVCSCVLSASDVASNLSTASRKPCVRGAGCRPARLSALPADG